ncbi:MAG: hypothetical protein LBG84_00285 [Treponema sp.]|jgi:hypothetical protein|nr:hypothetical protein [Treponema sp.]
MDFFRLSLRSSLYYRRLDPPLWRPFDPAAAGSREETLFCFALDPAQARRIDPEPEACLGSLGAAGTALPGGGPDTAGALELPAGLYYFTQVREWLDRAGCAAMAEELQKEGLWERRGLGARLYLRRLFEDGAPVTQFLRPLENEGPGP